MASSRGTGGLRRAGPRTQLPDRGPVAGESRTGGLRRAAPRTQAAGGGAATGKTDARSRPRLPLALLLLALSTVFLFGGGRGYFHGRDSNASTVMANTLAVAANLAPEHDFLLFYYRTLDEDGDAIYFPYNRFPVAGYGLIKLAMTPFGDSLSAQIRAARLLMLSFFSAAAVLACLSLGRLVANRWIALTATLLTFSSCHGLYYNDVVSNEMMPDLFGVLLTFHGMVVFAQEGRFRQLLVKACLALLLGWHVYALLLAFIVLGLGSELTKLLASRRPVPARSYLSLLRGRHVLLGVVSLLFGMAVLTFNLANEYLALQGEAALTELPTVESALRRTGQDHDFNTANAGRVAWLPFLAKQLQGVAATSVPCVFLDHARPLLEFARTPLVLLSVVMGVVVIGVLLIELRSVRHGILLATLASFGFCWTLPMRHAVAFVAFESMYYAGVPLVFFALILTRLRRRAGDRLVAVLAGAAWLVFVLSSFQAGHAGHDARSAGLQKAILGDFDAIRARTPPGSRIFVPVARSWRADAVFAGSRRALPYYLSGRIIVYDNDPERCRLADFLVTTRREEGPALLTPDNRLRFLYERTSALARHAHVPESCLEEGR